MVGSFLNVVILRGIKGESLFGSSNWRSHCPACKHPLSTLDLIPVFSFLFLKGKCRYCHKQISVQYPLVEGATAILFAGMFLAFLPHALHAKAGFVEESHLKHVVYGIMLVVLGLGILVYNNKALKILDKK